MSLLLHKGAKPFVRSGYFCKVRPCQFGESVSKLDNSCKHLVRIENDSASYPRYSCGIFDEIVGKLGWEMSPAFGAGCCSTIGNRDRGEILSRLTFDKHHGEE